jgi:hypothetical protein
MESFALVYLYTQTLPLTRTWSLFAEHRLFGTKLIAGGTNEAIAPGTVSIIARRDNWNEYLWRTGRGRRL